MAEATQLALDAGVDAAKIPQALKGGRADSAILQEYMPRKAVRGDALPSGVEGVPALPVAQIRSDAYLRFLAGELKPFIDATYRTRPGRDDTAIMG